MSCTLSTRRLRRGPDARQSHDLHPSSAGTSQSWSSALTRRTLRAFRVRGLECADALQLARVLPLNQRFAAVVMSHHLARDRDCMYALLKSDVTYLGVLGPRARTERMLTELVAREGSLPHIDDRFFSPVGMDIGGEGPDAIALPLFASLSDKR